MLKYAVVEIAGKQYTVEPNKSLVVNFLGDVEKYSCDKVLLTSDGTSIAVGKPYLKEKLDFKVSPSDRKEKVRVAKYHSKANTRKVIGSSQRFSKIVLAA